MSERGKMREVVVFRYTSKVYVVDRNRRKKQIPSSWWSSNGKCLVIVADAFRFPSTNSSK